MERITHFFQSEHGRFAIVALIASVATLQAHMIWTESRDRRKKEELNRELQELYRDDHLLPNPLRKRAEHEDNKVKSIASAVGGGAAIASPVALGVAGYDEGLIKEQLARNYAFFGEEGMASIRKATVVVVGCGGVGSWAAMMLART
jgi:tRNA threonylcarbamoyladenosine dehydratase